MTARALTLAEYFTLHGRPSITALIDNATELLRRVNGLAILLAADGIELTDDQVSRNPVASGYRPAGVNAKTANAAVSSKHLTCEGVDLQDHADRRIARWCLRNLPALERLGLWMEDPRWTGGRTNTDPWVHLQTRAPGSGRRVFVPSSAPPTAPALPEQAAAA